MTDPPASAEGDLALITETAVLSNRPDKPTKEEQEYEEKLIKNRLLRQLLLHRGTYAIGILLLVVMWLLGIFLILLWEGFRWKGFHLDNSVILAAIGSTTANIIGVLLIIVKFIFSDSSTPRTRRKVDRS